MVGAVMRVRGLILPWLCLSLVVCTDDDVTPDDTDGDATTGGADDGSGPGPTITAGSDSTTAPPPDTTGDVTGSTESSTGPAGVCGNEEVEAGEECDDGNTDDGDGCYSNCTLPFEIAWTASVHGGAGDDFGGDVVTDDAGNIYIGGWTSIAVGDTDVWIQQITADGRLGWSFTQGGVPGGDDVGFALAWAGSDLIIVGAQSQPLGEDGLVARVDSSDGSLVWVQYFDGPSASENGDRITQVAVDSDGSIVVAGRTSVDDVDADAWVAKLDDMGALVWEQTYAGAFGAFDTYNGLGIDPDGNVRVIGFEEVSAGEFDYFTATFDANGNDTGQEALAYTATDLAIDGAGLVAITGNEQPGNTFFDGSIHLYDAGFVEQWVTYVDGPTSDFDIMEAVAFAPDGELYVAGTVTELNEQSNLWAGRIGPDGQRRWEDIHNNDRLNIGEFGTAMAIDADGNAIAVGQENQLGEGTNVFVRKYVQAPPPR